MSSKIGVFTFTRDRVQYTQVCFTSIRKCVKHYPLDHYVLDNGSTDDTRIFLGKTISSYAGLICSPVNMGLHVSAQMISNIIQPCDLVIKIDNDCKIRDALSMQYIASIYTQLNKHNEKYILSPKIIGITKQPKRGDSRVISTPNGDFTLGHVGQVGGLFMAIPYELFKVLKFNSNLPMARGLDSAICSQAVSFGYRLAYVENMSVEHYQTTDGQCKVYPEYFKRKRIEEQNPFKGAI